ncbi:MAG: hypothetical protein GX927_12960 [Lentisphaerae bacterium]|nr:hypothetical protein [Lentisphaerota bacterium]
MLEITNIRQGAVLTHFHGKETADSLTVPVEGICDHGGEVLVNGIPAVCSGRRFTASVPLTKKFDAITATASSALGEYSQKIKVVWDKQSFKRFNFYIDDNIFFFTDLATQRPKHAFDHFYLKRLKEIHQRWGFKLTLNCFYHNAHQEFTLDQMPDCYKQEFIDQSDWLKFSFHSRSEFPDRPYEEVAFEDFCADYDLVRDHLIRICGEEYLIAPINVHWGALQPSCAEEFIRRGSPCSTCTMRPFVSGGPSSAARLGKKSDIAAVQQSSALTQGAAFGAEYFHRPEEDSYLLRERKYYNFELGVFIARGAICCNLVPLEETPARLKNYFALADETGNEVFGAASHEQYSFPYYNNYLPDHLDRIELTVKMLVEYGCKPVFFSQGLMGNLAWDK